MIGAGKYAGGFDASGLSSGPYRVLLKAGGRRSGCAVPIVR